MTETFTLHQVYDFTDDLQGKSIISYGVGPVGDAVVLVVDKNDEALPHGRHDNGSTADRVAGRNYTPKSYTTPVALSRP